MLKPLTFSVGLAVALGMSSLSLAGGHGKSLPSAQCEAPSAQCAAPSPQCDTGCGVGHGFKLPSLPKCDILGKLKPKPKCYTYEWVLKKKKVGGHFGGLFGGHGGGDACGEVVTPSGQCPSPQAYGSGQTHGSGQIYGSGQATGSYGSGQATGSYGSGQATGSGQAPAAPAAPAEEAPADSVPPPAANPPTASNGGLLFLAPAGN
jgi:hypothetical protein